MAKTKKKIKLDDIAEKLGFTKVTISKALREHPDISEATIKLVKTTAQKMGYVPNFSARNLSAKKTNTIGVVVPKIDHYFFGSIVESLYEKAFEKNYELILTVSQEDSKREKKHIETLLAMNVDGLIVAISKETKDYSIFETVKRFDVPLVFIDRIPNLKNINKIVVSDKQGTYEAIKHAIELGYRSIAHFASYTNINIGKERLAGFKKAMNDSSIPVKPDWIVKGGYREEYGYEAFMKLYKNNNLPELIFTETYPVALGIYKAARELNLTIPDDIDVICFGNADVQEFLNPPLSCVNQPTGLISESAVDLLIENINNNDSVEPKKIIIPTELILRGTCRKK